MGKVQGSRITTQNFRLPSGWRPHVSHKLARRAGPWLNLPDTGWHLACYTGGTIFGGNILDMIPIRGFYYRFRLWPSIVSYRKESGISAILNRCLHHGSAGHLAAEAAGAVFWPGHENATVSAVSLVHEMDIDRQKAVLVNGREQEVVSVCDRGLLYGDGVFETLAVKSGKALEFAWHLERLALGCRRLAIPCPAEDLLQREVDQLCTGQTQAILKIIVTRGTGARGYLAPRNPEVTRIMCLFPWPDYPVRFYREGVRVRCCRQRLCDNPALAGIKHLNRLEQVMARNEWHYPEVAEGLMCDYADNVIEATASNIFIVDAGILQTPDLSKAGVEGVMRRRILQLARETGMNSQIRPIPLQKLQDADEIFLCNSLIGIWPVRQIGKMRFGVGRITRRLLHAVEPYCAIDIRVPT